MSAAFSNFIDEELRRALRRTVSLTIPAAHVNEVVDIACHATVQALDALQRIAFDGHPDQRIAISASTLAMSLIRHRVNDLIEVSEKVAKESGMSCYRGTVSVER
jgi:hypothetical protein